MLHKKLCFLFLLGTSLYGEIGIISGSKTGNYIKIANDIKDVMNKEQIQVKVYEGNSMENIKGILKDKKYQFGIVQSDALNYYNREVYQKNKEKQAQKVKSKKRKERLLKAQLSDEIKMIFPLYNEEIHIAVRKKANINTIADLEGKRVNMSTSGSWVTGQNIKNEIGIEWQENRESNRTISMSKLINDELDAIIYVSGKPTDDFTWKKEISKYVKLLPYESDMYTPTTISSKDYSWVEGEVKSSAVKAILVTYNYTEEKAKKHVRFKEYVTNIKNISKIVNKHLPYLRKNKHKKWKEINPMDYKSVNWPVADVINKKRIDVMQFKKNSSEKIDIHQFKKE